MKFNVPGPIKNLFDSFPLTIYEGERTKCTTETNQPENNTMYFEELPNSNSSNMQFQLCVHNLNKAKFGTEFIYIPTDPLSLYVSLILCKKNNLRLPREDNSNSRRSKHCIRKVSFFASPDTQLPVMIETNLTDNSRDMRLSRSLLSQIEKSSSFSNDSLANYLNSYFDNNLTDLWIFGVIDELRNSKSCQSYNKKFRISDEIQGFEMYNYIVMVSSLATLPTWGSFNIKYPNLFHNSKLASIFSRLSEINSLSIADIVSGINPTSFNKIFNEKIEQFNSDIKPIIKYFRTNRTNDKMLVVELKLISFIVTVDLFIAEAGYLKNVLFSIDKEYIKHCHETIQKN